MAIRTTHHGMTIRTIHAQICEKLRMAITASQPSAIGNSASRDQHKA
jgi:hypothetical protein